MAIAFDNAISLFGGGGISSFTQSYTCSGTNRVLLVCGLAQNNQTITGVTYGGVAMTQVGTTINQSSIGGGENTNLWILINPASGANNIVVTASGTSANFVGGFAASYTGVAQTGQPDSHNQNSSASTTAFSVSTTAVADNCWIAGYQRSGSTVTAQTGTTLRGGGTNFAMIDSNGAKTPPGTYSLGVNISPADTSSMGLVSLAPFVQSSVAIRTIITQAVKRASFF